MKAFGSDNAYALGARLRQRREEAGLTQADVARRAGISRQLLVKIEAGHVRAEVGKVMLVVKALGAVLVIADAPAPTQSADLDAILGEA